MATIAGVTTLQPWAGETIHRVIWTPLANGDNGSVFEIAGSHEVSVQVRGTFGVGGTIIVEGTNDPASPPAAFATLNDQAAAAISFTAAGIKSIHNRVFKLRPRVTAGDGTTSLTVELIVRRSRTGRGA